MVQVCRPAQSFKAPLPSEAVGILISKCSQQTAVTCRSTFESIEERECFQGIVDWMNNAPNSANYTHGTVKSWFYWAYNPDSGGAFSLSIALIVHDSGRHTFSGLATLKQREPAHLAVLVSIPEDTSGSLNVLAQLLCLLRASSQHIVLLSS